jgi:hypothetical protein
MATIVYIVDPMFRAVVPAKWLGVLKGLPHTIHKPPSDVVLDLVENPVR